MLSKATTMLIYKSKLSAFTEEVKTQQFEYYVTQIKQSNINVHKMVEIIIKQKTYNILIIITLLDVIDGIILQKFSDKKYSFTFFVKKMKNNNRIYLSCLLNSSIGTNCEF